MRILYARLSYLKHNNTIALWLVETAFHPAAGYRKQTHDLFLNKYTEENKVAIEDYLYFRFLLSLNILTLLMVLSLTFKISIR
jgi:hypothetical protein